MASVSQQRETVGVQKWVPVTFHESIYRALPSCDGAQINTKRVLVLYVVCAGLTGASLKKLNTRW